MFGLKTSPVFLILTALGILSLSVYAIVVVVILKNWKFFNGSYYKLFLCSAFLNVFFYLSSWPIQRLPNVVCWDCTFSSFYQQGYFAGTNVLRFLYVLSVHQQTFLEVAMAVNRLTAVRWSMSYDRIWDEILIPVVCFTLLIPSILASPTLINENYIWYKSAPADLFVFDTKEDTLVRSNKILATNISGSVLIVLTSSYICYLFKKKQSFKNRKTEIRLFLHSLFTSTAMLLICLNTFIRHYFPNPWLDANYAAIKAYCTDLTQLGSPWVLILCSKEIRRRMGLSGNRKFSQVIPVPSSG